MISSVIGNSMTMGAFLLCVGAALVLGVLTALVFSIKSKHTASWKYSIALLPAIVAVVIMMVNGNIGVGLAVAGTFALVRFRSLPGSAKEVTGLFFAVALGLICGTGYIGFAFLFFAIITVAVLVLSAMKFGEADASVRVLKIVIPEDLDYDTVFDDLFEKYARRHELVRVRTTNLGTMFELTYEVILTDPKNSKQFIDELRCRNGNLNIIFGREQDLGTM